MIFIAQRKDLNYETARDTAVRFLSFKARSEREVTKRLERDGYPEEIISRVLSLLRRHGYINDDKFAASYIEERMNRRKFGGRRIAYELSVKGVDPSLIAEKMNEQEGELEAAIEAAGKKLKGRTIIDYSEKNRITAFLMRRGFSYGIIKEALVRIAELDGLAITGYYDECNIDVNYQEE